MSEKMQRAISTPAAVGTAGLMWVSEQLGWNWPYGVVLLVAFLSATCLGWAVIAWREFAFDWLHRRTSILLATKHTHWFNGVVLVAVLIGMIMIAVKSKPPQPQLAEPVPQKTMEMDFTRPGITTIDKTIINNPDGTYTNSRLVEIISRCPPGMLRFIARGKNIISYLRIKKTSQIMMLTGAGGRIGDSVFLEVENAWGKYMLIVNTRNADDVIFDYSCK